MKNFNGKKIICAVLLVVAVCAVTATFALQIDAVSPENELIAAAVPETEPAVTEFAVADMMVTEETLETVESTECIESEPVETEAYEDEIFDNPEAVEISNVKEASTANKTSSSNSDSYVGRWSIPSVGANVACYNRSGQHQEIVDGNDNAAYYYAYGHVIIADHVNQAFYGLKNCSVGTQASFTSNSGTTNYTCVGVINGYNTGSGLTDSNYNSIENMYPNTLVCYTCNENPNGVTIAFFSTGTDSQPYVTEKGNDVTLKGEDTDYLTALGICDYNKHAWSEWEITIEPTPEKNGTKRKTCKICDYVWLDTAYYVPEETEPTPDPEAEPTEPAETQPIEIVPEETVPAVAFETESTAIESTGSNHNEFSIS